MVLLASTQQYSMHETMICITTCVNVHFQITSAILWSFSIIMTIKYQFSMNSYLCAHDSQNNVDWCPKSQFMHINYSQNYASIIYLPPKVVSMSRNTVSTINEYGYDSQQKDAICNICGLYPTIQSTPECVFLLILTMFSGGSRQVSIVSVESPPFGRHETRALH